MVTINVLNGGNITIGSNGGESTEHADTWIKFSENDTWHEYDIEGAMDFSALIAAGLMPEGSGDWFEPRWTTQPYAVEIGTNVTSIVNYMFDGCSGLTSVTIPNIITSIGEGTFYNCTGLTSVTIGNGVESIGYYAFYGCSRLTSITIPERVTSIWDTAFYECDSLTSVTIGKSKSQVESMEYQNWGLGAGYDENWEVITFQVTIHCNDNQDIVINPAS